MYEDLKVRPRTAIALYTDGKPWYPYCNVISGQIRYVNRPELPNPDATWSRLFRGDMRLHVDLEDERTLAELLCCTRDPDNPIHMIDPMSVTLANLAERLERTLFECRCNPGILAGWIADEYDCDAMPHAFPRMIECRARAEFLLGAEGISPRVGGGVG